MKKTMHPLKSDHCYAVLDINGMAKKNSPGISGFFFRDTRHLSSYGWNMEGFDLIHSLEGSTGLVQFWSQFANHEQQLLIRREIRLRPDGFDDEIKLQNSGAKTRHFVPGLEFDGDFADVFELRGTRRNIPKNPVRSSRRDNEFQFSYEAGDGVRSKTLIHIKGALPGRKIEVSPGQTHNILVCARFSSSITPRNAREPKIRWASLESKDKKPEGPPLAQARLDIETLAISTRSGTCISAGIPNFVAMFGRDSLITAWFLLREAPELARGVLKFLALHQGQKNDEFHDEQRGKILHEFREGELSRMGELPFGPYFGSVDATPLFLRVLWDYVETSGDTNLAIELEDNWRSALEWMEMQRDQTGFLRYRGAVDGKGLINKCWKDSDDSMSYGDGSLGRGALAIVEVQGYASAAFAAGAYLNRVAGGSEEKSERLMELCHSTMEAIERHFWMEREQTYALALDREGRKLDVVSSNPGHLLWAGAVRKDRVKPLVERMFRQDLWSGWGLRTLASTERRYNPLSYHNGSVWPHDTALFGAGLYRYRQLKSFSLVREALGDLAAAQHDLRLPELVGGYGRDSGIPPLPYVESCRPQAWSAASLIYMLHPHGAKSPTPMDMATA